MALTFNPLYLALPYTHADDVETKQFLGGYKGRGVVCTSVDKADTTLIFACLKLYIDQLMTDLEEGGTYQPTPLTHSALLQRHNSFLQHHGIPIEQDWRSMPFYFGTFKLHKAGMRFISSSNTSSMKTVSLWLNKVLTQVLTDVDRLFADVLRSVGITAEWTQRSWILKNTTAAMPLIHAWNSIFSATSTAQPMLHTYDFKRFYTNIDTADMKAQIMRLIRKIFAAHPGHAGITVWQKAPAVWLKPNRMPAPNAPRHGTGPAGYFFIFDLASVQTFLHFLLDNMFVAFGDTLLQQIIGTPMGTNCASLLANFFLAMYELAFVERPAAVILDVQAPQPKRDQVGKIMNGFLMSGRFLDDFLSINNPYLKHLLYTSQSFFYPDVTGIYPDTLELALAHTGTSIPYMDIKIISEPGGRRRITTQLYDKRKHPPLSEVFIIKYPHMSSKISSTAKYGIVTSQFHRLRRIILQRRNFVDNMADILHTLTVKGYNTEGMLGRVRFLC